MDKEKIIATTIPLSENQLDEYFDSIEDFYFEIDLDKSEYEGKTFINYLYNAGMNCDVKINTYGEKLAELLKEYITTNKLISIPSLNKIWIDIICSYSSKIKFENVEYNNFITKFINDQKELIDELITILFSLKIFLIAEAVEEHIVGEKSSSKNIQNNFISLRNDNDFWIMLEKIDTLNPKYYEYEEFKKPIYDGYEIAYYFFNDFNPISFLKIFNDLPDKEE